MVSGVEVLSQNKTPDDTFDATILPLFPSDRQLGLTLVAAVITYIVWFVFFLSAKTGKLQAPGAFPHPHLSQPQLYVIGGQPRLLINSN